MWIFVPGCDPCSPSSPSAPVPAGSISESSWPFPQLARSATWRSKRTPVKSWLRAWRREHWLRRLCGRISEPSTATRGVESWISSLAASRARVGRSPGSAAGSATPATSGRSSRGSSGSAKPPSPLSRMFPALCVSMDSVSSLESFTRWATALRRVCSARMKSARPTCGSGSSSSPTPRTTTRTKLGNVWPTPAVVDAQGRGYTYSQGDHDKVTLCLPGAAQRAAGKLWPTPRASPNENRSASKPPSHGKTHGTSLAAEASTWATPTTRDHKDGACAKTAAPTNGLLGRQAARWSGPPSPPRSVSPHPTHPTPTTLTDGNTTSLPTPTSRQPSRVLNPAFVEALMGWPAGWSMVTASPTGSIGSASPGTVSCPAPRPSPSARCSTRSKRR